MVSGGIGIAPLLLAVKGLSDCEVTLCCGFRDQSYALDSFRPYVQEIRVATDSGKEGHKGFVPICLTGDFDMVVTCGPEIMMEKLAKSCIAKKVPCYVSMERHMAAAWAPAWAAPITPPTGRNAFARTVRCLKGRKSMLKTVLNGVTLKNPVIAASGTFGFGQEYDQFFDISRLGGISSKGLTLEERFGNEGERIYETPSGLINSIGLQNPGVDAFIRDDLPFLRQKDTAVIANLGGSTIESYLEGVEN